MLVEHWITQHRRALLVEQEGVRVYSIDVYLRLSGRPERCDDGPAAGEARLCYVRSGGCEAVVSETPGTLELISVRLYTGPDEDPAEGDPVRALQLCSRQLAPLLGVRVDEVLRSPEWRQG